MEKSDDVISLQEIKDALNSTETEWFLNIGLIVWRSIILLLLEIMLYSIKNYSIGCQYSKENLESYTNILEKNLFSGNFSTNLRNSEKDIKIWDIKMTAKTLIKETIQIVLQFEQILRYFSLEKWQWKDKELIDVEFDSDFYNEKDKFYSDDFKPYKFFNAVRNYVTKNNIQLIKLS